MGEPAPKRQRIATDANGEETRPSRSQGDSGANTQRILEQIDAIQGEIDTLNEKASEEILKVEQKYNSLRKPFYEKRNELVKNIAHFWATAVISHPNISAILEEDEEEIIHYLNKLEVEEYDDIKSGYRIKFSFDENPFFENEAIIKEFLLGNTEPTSKTTEIKWKAGNNLINQLKSKCNQGEDSPANPRSFFLWLIDNSDASNDEFAELIKDDLWPNPLQYYLLSEGEGGCFYEEEVSDNEAVEDLEELDEVGEEHEDD